MKIEDAIQQATFENLANKTGINILFTAAWIQQLLSKTLKPFGISWQQFNILRILNGQKGNPVPLWLVTERMIDRMSNTSRLVDKLVDKGLVMRRECPQDRRRVDLLMSPEGERLLTEAWNKVKKQIDPVFTKMTDDQLVHLNDLLDAVREEEPIKR